MHLRTTPVITLALVLALCAFGQTASTAPVTSTSPTTAALPSTWGVSVGAEVTAYNKPVQYVPTIGVMGCWTHLCEISTLEMAPSIATVRQEVAYQAKQSADKNSMLLILVGGGLTGTTTTAGLLPSSLNLGNVGGGVAFVYDLGGLIKPLKGAGVKFKASVRENAVTSLGVKPQYQAELVYRFK